MSASYINYKIDSRKLDQHSWVTKLPFFQGLYTYENRTRVPVLLIIMCLLFHIFVGTRTIHGRGSKGFNIAKKRN